MNIPIYQIDAFTRRLFGGNPAAVMPLTGWLPDAMLQALAFENNLSETAFLLGGDGRYGLRWFTPTQEVQFCGHATLASAWALWERRGETAEVLTFQTQAGELRAVRGPEGSVRLDLPRYEAMPVSVQPPELSLLLGVTVLETFTSQDGYHSVYARLDSEEAVRRIRPQFRRLGDVSDLVVTAQAREGSGADFVSRVFAPGVGIPEDPATGSAHSTLAPYWAERLGTPVLLARQLSARGGELHCEVGPKQVTVSGHAVLYSEGTVALPEDA